MPSYKTHSIHGEVIFPQIDMFVPIKIDDFKTFCVGPDLLILTDYELFKKHHVNKTREYFENLIRLIKERKLNDNSEVMAFLYGQIDHMVLDSTIHPLIYYMTEDLRKESILEPHTLVEMWIDDYVIKKYGKTDIDFYHKLEINSKDLRLLINKLYEDIYVKKNTGTKYSIGMKSIILFELVVRYNVLRLMNPVNGIINLGDITYGDKEEKVYPFLNLENDKWYNPFSLEEKDESFMDLWQQASERSLEVIDDVNNHLYYDKSLSNHWILDDTSYNTGLPIEKGQRLKYVKKWY